MIPHPLKPSRHLNLGDYGSEIMVLCDVNGDGRKEFVFMQGPGMLAADPFKPDHQGPYGTHCTTPEDQALDCLTALDDAGRVLWQNGKPWSGNVPFRQHGGAWMMMAGDFRGIGREDLVRIRGSRLQMIEGLSGRCLHETNLDSDGYSSLFPAHFSPDKSCAIIVKPVDEGVNGHPYCCPFLAYDSSLRLLWGPRDVDMAGHTPLAYDVDGDGLDELLAGSQCLNADGTVRWSLPLKRLAGFPLHEGHPDRRIVVDIDEDGKPEQVLAFEYHGIVVSDLQGNLLWTRPVPHCGDACVGKFLADCKGLQIFGNNEYWRVAQGGGPMKASYLLDCGGREIWTSELDMYASCVDWPTAVGPQAILARPHVPDPPDARPFVLDGNGKQIAEFDLPRRLPSRQDFVLPHSGQEWGDWGDYYSCLCVALQQGEPPCVVVWTRRDLWVFEPPK
jgi:hypothetical protein